jgi:hypothetical protein
VTAKSKAIDRAAHIGPTPLGYVRNDEGTPAVDPITGPVVSEAFAIFARDGLPACPRRPHAGHADLAAGDLLRDLGLTGQLALDVGPCAPEQPPGVHSTARS